MSKKGPGRLGPKGQISPTSVNTGTRFPLPARGAVVQQLSTAAHHNTISNLADDADTVAAVTGQIAGALWGRSGIPAHWLDRLAWREDTENRGRLLLGCTLEAAPTR